MGSSEIISKLNEAFLPNNVECDGSYCMGCWKDVIRSGIKMIEAKIKELEETVKDRESHATFLQEKRNELQSECDNRLEKIKELEAEIESLRIIANDVATFSSNNVTTIDLKRKAQFYFKQYPLKPQDK